MLTFDEPLTREMKSAIKVRQNLLQKTMVKVTISKDGRKSVLRA